MTLQVKLSGFQHMLNLNILTTYTSDTSKNNFKKKSDDYNMCLKKDFQD